MTQLQMFCILIPGAYLLGAIPVGLLVGLSRGVDPRKSGSGNIGATNLGRLLGHKFFWIVFFLDLAKGLIPTLAAGALLGFHATDRTGYCLWIVTGFAAMLGHTFSIFLRFKGGKGVATSSGVILGVFPYLTLPAASGLVVFLVVFKATRYVSLASMIGSFAVPIFYVAFALALHWPFLDEQLPVLCLANAMPVLIIYKHRGNIQRLRSGTENKVGAP